MDFDRAISIVEDASASVTGNKVIQSHFQDIIKELEVMQNKKKLTDEILSCARFFEEMIQKMGAATLNGNVVSSGRVAATVHIRKHTNLTFEEASKLVNMFTNLSNVTVVENT